MSNLNQNASGVNLGVVGASGRMGRMLISTILDQADAHLAAACDMAGSEVISQDAASLVGKGTCGVLVSDKAAEVFAASDVVIDFTHFSATPGHLALAREHKTNLFLGTTGLPAETQAEVERSAQQIGLIQAANTSLGVNLLALLVEQAARSLDPSFDVEVVEIHHNQKVDSPSGTALMLGKAAALGRDQNHDEVACYERSGHVGARPTGEIGYATLRGGDVAGEHTVMLVGEQERIEISHRATSRTIFAAGAVKGAIWLGAKSAGLYSMRDVLGLNKL